MIFLDINTFYGPRAGGIRTYHDAKIAAFSRREEHLYGLVHPGPRARADSPASSVRVLQVRGLALTADPAGYRLILNYIPVALWIRRLRPDVIETGDAWLTAWFCLLLRAAGLWNGLLVSFYHSDPVPSYLLPWAARGGRLRRLAASVLGRMFYAVQARFDWTAVSSRVMEASLRRQGVTRVCLLPFGADPVYFHPPASPEPLRRRGAAEAPARLLYAGRLDRDKGVELLLEILPALLEDPEIHVTVAGRGALAERFAAFKHPRFRFAGFLEGPAAMAALYGGHDVLLAPGPHETFGMAVLEAMAAGLPVVGPRAGGTGELLAEAGSVFTFEPGNARDFLDKARTAAAADLPAESARHHAVARGYGTWDEAVERMIAAWRERA